MRPDTALKILPQLANYPVAFLDEFAEDVVELVAPGSYLYGYCEGELSLHWHFIDGFGGVNDEDHCAILHACGEGIEAIFGDRDLGGVDSHQRGDDELVLVHYVERMEKPKRMRLGIIRSFCERLQSLDMCYYGARHASGLASMALSEAVSSFAVLEDGELNAGEVVRPVLGDDDFAGKVVEGAPQVVDDLAQDQGPSQDVGRGIKMRTPHVLASGRIFFGSRQVEFAPCERVDFPAQVTGLFLGPAKPCLYSVDGGNAHSKRASLTKGDMSGKREGPDEGEKTQKTDDGYEIPIPKRGAFYDALQKAVEPHDEDEGESDRSKGGKSKK